MIAAALAHQDAAQRIHDDIQQRRQAQPLIDPRVNLPPRPLPLFPFVPQPRPAPNAGQNAGNPILLGDSPIRLPPPEVRANFSNDNVFLPLLLRGNVDELQQIGNYQPLQQLLNNRPDGRPPNLRDHVRAMTRIHNQARQNHLQNGLPLPLRLPDAAAGQVGQPSGQPAAPVAPEAQASPLRNRVRDAMA